MLHLSTSDPEKKHTGGKGGAGRGGGDVVLKKQHAEIMGSIKKEVESVELFSSRKVYPQPPWALPRHCFDFFWWNNPIKSIYGIPEINDIPEIKK